jgi:hypothetical protein
LTELIKTRKIVLLKQEIISKLAAKKNCVVSVGDEDKMIEKLPKFEEVESDERYSNVHYTDQCSQERKNI